ncbi:MAG: AmmeMemoRadiSam system protein B [Balneolaceae bacterium]|nr:AmmeMemoRadiSam system protein B [Balneolaceae bacterium]
MNITDYSKEQIQEGLEKARKEHDGVNDQIRLLFAPIRIDEENFDIACNIYSRIDPGGFNTAVVVEAYDEVLEKKLPMPSNRFFKTPLGEVPVNDFMRNEFCDEEDDFFIHDEGYSKQMSLFQQLMFLQTVKEDFSALSIQIADREQPIVKELAYVLEEVLASRSALLIFCCELANSRKKEFERIRKMVKKKNHSGLLNYLNSGESHIEGTTSFIAGVLVANTWELNLNFLNGEYDRYNGSLLTAYGDREKVLF